MVAKRGKETAKKAVPKKEPATKSVPKKVATKKALVKKPAPKKAKSQKQVVEEQRLAKLEADYNNDSESDDEESSEDEKPVKKAAAASVKKAIASKRQVKEEMSEGSDDDVDSEEASSNDDDEDDSELKSNKSRPFFSDDNAAWLKPKGKKAQLMSSDEEENDDEFGHDLEDDEEEEELEVEKESRILDAEMETEKEEAEEEMRRTIAQNTAIFHLPTSEELALDTDRAIPPSEIRARIESILEVLADFKSRRETNRSRTDYVDQLVSDIAELHGYLPELVDYFHSMFGPSETLEFVEASDRPRPLVVRTNTLKARRKDLASALMKRGVALDPLAAWSKVGLKIIESPVPIGATPEYLSGHYMLQSAASMCPVMSLAPQPSERCLDMSAAPGGKTSYMAQLMKNTGVIIANDLKAERQKATVANLHRLGVKNVIACTHDGRKLGKKFHNSFDRILLDAPCSGLGVISRDPSVKVQRTMADVQKVAHLQKELLLSAIDALNHKSKTGGCMVYSTCSVTVYENEEVINYALSKRDIKIIDSGLDFGKPGFTRYLQKRFHPSVALTRRFYPHVHNMDGFYVAKIQKLSDRRPDDTKEPEMEATAVAAEESKPADSTLVNVDAESSDEEEAPKKKWVMQGKKRSKRKEDDTPKKSKKAKSDHLSVPPKRVVPPTKVATTKKLASAKTSKPRRRKLEADS